MHMTDALLSPAVGITMCAAGGAAIAYSVKKITKDELCEKKIPVMGVMGAFIFAAQMINFAIPGTGSSGHIGGGILLAAMIGGFPALLTLSTVIIIQSLFFADGGLIALGCNIFNLGIIPCLVVYPYVFKPLVKNGMTAKNITAASVAASVAALQLGAFCVVLQTLLSGITELPFRAFALSMQPIHLAIGFAEGIITAAILCFVYRLRPEIMESALERTAIKSGVSMRTIIVTITLAAVLAGGLLARFASSRPDGLEWSIEKTAGTADIEARGSIMEGAESLQETIAVMPDYGSDSKPGTSAAGIFGAALAFLLAGTTAFAIFAVKKRQKSHTAVSA